MFDFSFDDLLDADLPDALPCTCTLKSFENIPARDRFAYVIESLPTVPAAHCACGCDATRTSVLDRQSRGRFFDRT